MSKPRNEYTYNEILRYIQEYYDEYSRSPSVREIASNVNLAPSTTQFYIDRLVEDAKVERIPGSRGIRLASNSVPKINVPLVGVIACGAPIFAEENIEDYIPISRKVLGPGDFFALRARGDSMINAGIEDGDIVFIKKQNTAEEGQIVVALINNDATLKRFYMDTKTHKVRLHPENDKYEDIYVDECMIQGVAKKVLKDVF